MSLNSLDPDRLVRVVKLEPNGMGNPIVFSLEDKGGRHALVEEVLMHLDNIEEGDAVTLTLSKMTVGDLTTLPEHQGW